MIARGAARAVARHGGRTSRPRRASSSGDSRRTVGATRRQLRSVVARGGAARPRRVSSDAAAVVARPLAPGASASRSARARASTRVGASGVSSARKRCATRRRRPSGVAPFRQRAGAAAARPPFEDAVTARTPPGACRCEPDARRGAMGIGFRERLRRRLGAPHLAPSRAIADACDGAAGAHGASTACGAPRPRAAREARPTTGAARETPFVRRGAVCRSRVERPPARAFAEVVAPRRVSIGHVLARGGGRASVGSALVDRARPCARSDDSRRARRAPSPPRHRRDARGGGAAATRRLRTRREIVAGPMPTVARHRTAVAPRRRRRADVARASAAWRRVTSDVLAGPREGLRRRSTRTLRRSPPFAHWRTCAAPDAGGDRASSRARRRGRARSRRRARAP